MATARRLMVILLVALALLLPAQPALAQGGGHTVFGQEYTLGDGEHLAGDLVVLGSAAQLRPDSIVDGNVTVMGGETVIEGRVRGDVVALGGSLELGAGAEIEGDLVAFGNVRRHAEASVRGDLVTGPDAARRLDGLTRMFDGRVARPPRTPVQARPSEDWSWFGRLARQILAIGTALAAAALVSVLFPNHLNRVTRAMSTAWLQSAGVGALTGAVALVLAPVLAITCIGLPVSIVLLVALGVSVLLGWTGAGQMVGARVARAANLRLTSTLAETLLGVALISLVAMLPCLGVLAALLVAAWGLGAVVLTRLGTRAYLPTPLPPHPEGDTAGASRGGTHPLEALPGDESGGTAE